MTHPDCNKMSELKKGSLWEQEGDLKDHNFGRRPYTIWFHCEEISATKQSFD
jgi:hypothetical protein